MTAPVRTDASNEREHRGEISRALNLALQGRVGVVTALTIANATTSTVVSNVLAHAGSVSLLIPTNATAANMTTPPYITARGDKTFTLTHSDPGASATFLYILLG